MNSSRKQFSVLFVLASALFWSAGAQAEMSEDEKILRHFKTVLWPQAYQTQDVALLDSMLHESFQMLDGNGNRSTKAKELADLPKYPWNPKNFRYTIVRLDIYNDRFAVVDGIGESDTYAYVSSNYLIKEDGRWQAISSHVSGGREKAAAEAQ